MKHYFPFLWSFGFSLVLTFGAMAAPQVHCDDGAQPDPRWSEKLESCAMRVFEGGYRNAGEEKACSREMRIQTESGFGLQNTGGLFQMPSPFLIKCSDYFAESAVGPDDLALALLAINGQKGTGVPGFVLACTYYFKDLTQNDLAPWEHYEISFQRRANLQFWMHSLAMITGDLSPGDSLGGVFHINYQSPKAQKKSCRFFE